MANQEMKGEIIMEVIIDLFSDQAFTSRNPNANFTLESSYKIGKNILSNRFVLPNNKISFESLNLNYDLYKIYGKKYLLMMLREKLSKLERGTLVFKHQCNT